VTDREREAFEKWASESMDAPSFWRRGSDNTYVSSEVQYAWQIWRDARRSGYLEALEALISDNERSRGAHLFVESGYWDNAKIHIRQLMGVVMDSAP
jgi:hypothetical protein